MSTNCFHPFTSLQQPKVSPTREQKRSVLVQESPRQMQTLKDVTLRLAIATFWTESVPQHAGARHESIPQHVGPRIIFNEQFQSILSEEKILRHFVKCASFRDT